MLGVEDVYDLLEISMIDAHNTRLITEKQMAEHEKNQRG